MRRARQQAGHIYARSGWWWLRFRESVVEDGQLLRRHLARRIEPIATEHRRLRRPPREIEQKAAIMLAPLNHQTYTPEATQTLAEFVERVYFPAIENQKRASTVKGYKARWRSQLAARCGDFRLRDDHCSDAQRLLTEVARQDPNLCRSTLHHLRSLLSAIFRHAIQQGYMNGPNPIREVGIPRAPEGEDTYAYSLDEITRMLLYLPQPAHTICAVAAFTGLRRAELAGLVWENYDGSQINVTRSVWEGHVNEPKTRKSKAPVPVIAPLQKSLDGYRAQCGNPQTGIMFRSSVDTPLSMNNVLNRMILPALNFCVHCRKERAEHVQADHNYERDPARPAWRGWHSFRRGLATNLHDLGVADKEIQSILRHANLSTTMNIYVKSVSARSTAAMKMLESALCANCAPAATPVVEAVVN
jgi:integrase